MSESQQDASAGSEPIHWCDLFRSLEHAGATDPRYASRGVIDPDGKIRPMKFEEHWRDIDALALHDGVPSPIRIHFDTARNLLLHSWFVYRFQQVAEMHAYASVEFALRWRAKPRKGVDLKVLLGRAVRKGWIRAEGFRRYQEAVAMRAEYEETESVATGSLPKPSRSHGDWYVGMLAEMLPEFRNKLAHGSALLAPRGKKTLALCCDLIDQLFPADRAIGTTDELHHAP